MPSQDPPPAQAPVLSTPETHIFEDPTEPVESGGQGAFGTQLSDAQLAEVYEVERTAEEIRTAGWRRVALQFPDQLLGDAGRVYGLLARAVREGEVVEGVERLGLEEGREKEKKEEEEVQLFILGDTSYGACCVDEVAAEHVDAEVVVHYGRACLSPTARLPVVYVFTRRPLDVERVVAVFRGTYEKGEKVVVMADVPYAHWVGEVVGRLREEGYAECWATEVVRDSSSLLPNRTVPVTDPDGLREWRLFHVADPPTSLLLTLSSRVKDVRIYPVVHEDGGEAPREALSISSAMTLRRRYALLTKLAAVDVFGILINTLSVKNYMDVLAHVQRQIAKAGKKAYTFVVGKVNAAKVANFSEVGGWVVIGCWESSLIESKDFWRPIITPFELSLALQGDEERVWTGEWRGDFESVLKEGEKAERAEEERLRATDGDVNGSGEHADAEEDDSEEESAPPEFDLRTGRYVSHSRPMRTSARSGTAQGNGISRTSKQSLVKRVNGDVAAIGGVVSPGAEYLRTQRTWQGLGSDFEISYEEQREGAVMEEGRSGLARGYVVGDDRSAH